MMTVSELETSLELLIDRNDLQAVVRALANVCFQKTEHILANWQDEPLANAWSINGERLDDLRLEVV